MAIDESITTPIPASTGTAAQWASTNVPIDQGVLCYESDTKKFKIGDGVSLYTALSYQGAGAVTRISMSIPVRQTVLSGLADSNGHAAFITNSGLVPNILATTTPMTMTFAAGFGATYGALDYVEQIIADTTSFFSALPVNNLSFLSITRTGPGALTGGSTLAPPQYGYAYNQTTQSLLHFEA